MSRPLNLLCFFGIFVILFFDEAVSRRPRIRGGDFTAEGQFPYHVALKLLGGGICGGSILTERFVVTAAHCVINGENRFKKISVTVVAGSIDLKSVTSSSILVDVAKVYVPVEYDPKKLPLSGDIAILELKHDLDIAGNSKLGQVKLPENNENTFERKNAIVSGFGSNEFNKRFNQSTQIYDVVSIKMDYKLRFAEANVTSNDDCEHKYGGSPLYIAKHLCAALVQRNKKEPEGVCAGDSGSGLIYNGTIIGVASVGVLNCREDVEAAIYTRVSYYLGFINNVLKGTINENIRTNISGINEETYDEHDRLPYQVFLERDGRYFCGASILTERFVVTAAQCVIDQDGSFIDLPLKVVAVIDDPKSGFTSRVAIDVVKVYVPAEYNPVELDNKDKPTGNLAILDLKDDLDFEHNPELGKVKLPENNKNNFEGQNATISSFGFNELNLHLNNQSSQLYHEVDSKRVFKLRFAEANVTSNTDCEYKYGGSLGVTAKHLCASFQPDKSIPAGFCGGDSGSGLIHDGTIIGIAISNPTGSTGCRQNLQPAVYTRVSEYLSFINDVLNGKID